MQMISKLSSIVLGKKIPKAQSTEKKFGLYQNWKVSYIKGHYQESEKTPHGWEKIFANNISDKGLITRICISTIRKQLNPKMVKGLK